jgi:UDP-MurNAc hydroxylase
MRATSIGHAGILVQTRQATSVCDPWFLPAFLGSWFVFPRNDELSPELMAAIESPDYLYISHQHADHLDETWLATHVDKTTKVLLPDFATRELERRLSKLGFTHFVRTQNGKELDLGDGLTVAIHVESAIADGPGGDSAIVISDGESRLVNQNDCRTGDLGALTKHGPVDIHWLQFSGAIWYPMVYDEPRESLLQQAHTKVESQFARSMKYVSSVDARVVMPSAGPPCFLDEDLFSANMITGNELSIFPDQTEFIKRLKANGNDRAVLNIPGTTIELSPASVVITHPVSDELVQRPFVHKEAYLREYQADWSEWLRDYKSTWPKQQTDLLKQLQDWWQPLMAMAPKLRQAIGGGCLLKTEGLELYIDFAKGLVEPFADQKCRYRFEIARPLLEMTVANKAVDWSNSLFLSCRFTAWRDGAYNEYLYNFFKSLSVERMRRAEQEAVRRTDPNNAPTQLSSEIEIDGYVMERFCPHRQADLSEFGHIKNGFVVCDLHGWRFSVDDGHCSNADDRKLKIRKRTS